MLEQPGEAIRKCDSGTANSFHQGKLPRHILKLKDDYMAALEAATPGSQRRKSRLVGGIDYLTLPAAHD
jgi:hypothetical protein